MEVLVYTRNLGINPKSVKIYGCISFFSHHIKNHPFFLRFRQDALIYCIVAKNYDKQKKLDKKSSTVRKNEMHLILPIYAQLMK